MEPHIIIAHMVMKTLFILPAPFLRSSAVRCKALIALHDIIISIKLSTKIFLQRDGITAFAPSGRTKAAAPPFSPPGRPVERCRALALGALIFLPGGHAASDMAFRLVVLQDLPHGLGPKGVQAL